MADEAYAHMVKVPVFHKSIYGSLVDGNKYEPDTLPEVMAWLHVLIADIPAEYRATAKMEIESVGGYEGEHHAEVAVYYERPETEEERAGRIDCEKRWYEDQLARAQRMMDEAKRGLGFGAETGSG